MSNTASTMVRAAASSSATLEAVAYRGGQATGRAGREFPAEFKTGLDSYFGLLESQSSGR